MSVGPIIHIGYHKTATTWFQTGFYPHVTNAHYIPRARVRQALLEPTALHFDAGKARALLDPPGGGRMLLCEEGLSGYLHNGGLAGYLSKDMVHRLRSTFPDAEIVIFVRSQASAIAAAYQQYVKGGGTYSVSRYLFPGHYLVGASAETAKIPRFSFDHFEYDRLIALYREAFGATRVHVFLFEEFRADPEAFLQRYCVQLGLDVPLARLSLRPVYRSYNWAALFVSRFLALFTARTVGDKHWLVHIPFCYPITRAIGEGLSRLSFLGKPTPRGLLGRRLSDWVERHYVESNRRLAEQTGLPLERFGYPVQPSNAPEAVPVRPILPRWMRI